MYLVIELVTDLSQKLCSLEKWYGGPIISWNIDPETDAFMKIGPEPIFGKKNPTKNTLYKLL